MNGATRLYTPQVLALTLRLAEYPWRGDFAFHGEARSPSCGSTLAIGLDCSPDGAIAAIGIKAQACAVGQAAAAIFAGAAIGMTQQQIARGESQLRAWLADGGEMPDWPGIAALEAARAYPARHGAILLAWQAALRALPTA